MWRLKSPAHRFLRYAALRAWRTKARQAHSDWKRRDHSSSVPKAHLSERRGHTNLKSARRELWKSPFRFGPQSQVAREKARRRASAIIHSVAPSPSFPNASRYRVIVGCMWSTQICATAQKILATQQIYHDAMLSARRFKVLRIGKSRCANGVRQVHVMLDEVQQELVAAKSKHFHMKEVVRGVDSLQVAGFDSSFVRFMDLEKFSDIAPSTGSGIRSAA